MLRAATVFRSINRISVFYRKILQPSFEKIRFLEIVSRGTLTDRLADARLPSSFHYAETRRRGRQKAENGGQKTEEKRETAARFDS